MQTRSDAVPGGTIAVAPRPGLSVLVVEDDDADTYLILRALQDNPMIGATSHARNGVEAIAMLERGESAPDLALIDLDMPRMDGFGLLFALSGRPGTDFPKVVLTTSVSPSDAIRCRLRSAIRVVTKPDTVMEMYAVLKTTIDAVCHRRRSARFTGPRPAKSPEYLYLGAPSARLRRLPPDDETA